jgi:hypothetical protein
MFVAVLVGKRSFAVGTFWALWDNFHECYNGCHGNPVKKFWAL